MLRCHRKNRSGRTDMQTGNVARRVVAPIGRARVLVRALPGRRPVPCGVTLSYIYPGARVMR
jgi:hypothetical protein